jgi:hypothetical protein
MSPYNGPDRRASDNTRALFARVILGQAFVMVLIVFSIWLSSYEGRKNVVQSQRSGCERAKLDRRANAQGWRTAQAARQVTANEPPGDGGPSDEERSAAKVASDRYQEIADGLDRRSRIDCTAVFPKPKLIEFR